jgi:hypothetical protein
VLIVNSELESVLICEVLNLTCEFERVWKCVVPIVNNLFGVFVEM